MTAVPYSSWSGNTVSSSVAVHPASLAKHPQRWTKDEVRVWLRWCSEEFSIETVPPDKFDMNGKAICLLSRSDFMERLPRNGDVLYNCLQNLISKNIGGGVVGQHHQPTPSSLIGSSLPYADNRVSLPTEPFPAGLFLVSGSDTQYSRMAHSPTPGAHVPIRSFIPIQPRPGQSTLSSLSVANPILSRSAPNLPLKVVERMSLEDDSACSMDSETSPSSQSRGQTTGSSVVKTEKRPSPVQDTNKDCLASLRAHRSADCRLLWEFIHQLLLDAKYSKYVCWENTDDYVFRIANPTGLAELWGQQKNRTNMTYEKLSRALRYYYRMNIIRKVPGKRLTYKFLQPPSMIQKGQRGAKPHSKIHIPSTIPSVINDPSLHYEDESDLDSPPSDMDSPENPESKPNVIDDSNALQGDFLRTNHTNALHKQSPSELVTSSMNFPLHLPSFRQAPGFGTNLGMMQHKNMYEPSHSAFQHLDPNIPNEYYRVRDGLAEKAGTVIRPMPSYPPMSECGPFPNYRKQEPNLVKAHSTNSKDIGLGKQERVLRLPIDNLYRSLSCEFPVKGNELMVPYSGNRPGHARSLSPRPDLQLEPEDLSVRRITELDSHYSSSEKINYRRGDVRCSSVDSERLEYCIKNGNDKTLPSRSDSR